MRAREPQVLRVYVFLPGNCKRKPHHHIHKETTTRVETGVEAPPKGYPRQAIQKGEKKKKNTSLREEIFLKKLETHKENNRRNESCLKSERPI